MYSRVLKKLAVLLSVCIVQVQVQAQAQVQTNVIDGEELVDPTRPLFAGRPNIEGDSVVQAMIRNVVPSSYDLSFIRAGSSPIAVINQERVTVGDVVGGATVVSIDRSSVTLSINGAEQRISLYDDLIKRPATQ